MSTQSPGPNGPPDVTIPVHNLIATATFLVVIEVLIAAALFVLKHFFLPFI